MLTQSAQRPVFILTRSALWLDSYVVLYFAVIFMSQRPHLLIFTSFHTGFRERRRQAWVESCYKGVSLPLVRWWALTHCTNEQRTFLTHIWKAPALNIRFCAFSNSKMNISVKLQTFRPRNSRNWPPNKNTFWPKIVPQNSEAIDIMFPLVLASFLTPSILRMSLFAYLPHRGHVQANDINVRSATRNSVSSRDFEATFVSSMTVSVSLCFMCMTRFSGAAHNCILLGRQNTVCVRLFGLANSGAT